MKAKLAIDFGYVKPPPYLVSQEQNGALTPIQVAWHQVKEGLKKTPWMENPVSKKIHV
jgi:hypothetical protein